MPSPVHHESGSSHLILDMPHSGTAGLANPDDLPKEVRDNLRLDSEAVRRTLAMGVDVAVPQMTGFHDQTDHTRVWTDLPRVALDVNRGKSDVDELSVEGAGEPQHTHGLLWRGTVAHGLDFSSGPAAVQAEAEKRMEDVLKKPYSREEFERLLALGYDPYYAALQAAMDEVVGAKGGAVMLGLHTFPEFAPGKLESGRYAGAYALGGKVSRGSLAQRKLPDLISIHNGGDAATPRVLEVVRSIFEEDGYVVEDGIGPFTGDNGSTVLYAAPLEGRNVVGLEFVTREVEIDRDQGTLKVDEDAASRVRGTYNKLFERLSELSVDDLRA